MIHTFGEEVLFENNILDTFFFLKNRVTRFIFVNFSILNVSSSKHRGIVKKVSHKFFAILLSSVIVNHTFLTNDKVNESIDLGMYKKKPP
jgi:hypothetical protein